MSDANGAWPYLPGRELLDRLYDLLPAHLRAEDARAGQVIRALTRIATETFDVIRADIERRYDNLFIETCDPWVVPYLAALVGFTALPASQARSAESLDTPRGRRRLGLIQPRAEAANTVSFRRRKGTLAVLEELARAVTGWPARVVEARALAGHLLHSASPVPERSRLADVRRSDALERGPGPFSTLARLAETRSATHRRPVGSVGDLTLHVWTARVHRANRAPALRLGEAPDRGACRPDEARYVYALDPLGARTPPLHRPNAATDPTRLAEEAELPVPIRPGLFQRHPARDYGPRRSLAIWERREGQRSPTLVPAERLVLADLDPAPPPGLPAGSIALDLNRGRIAVVESRPPDGQYRPAPPEFWATYHYAAPGDLGGGDYPRDPSGPADAVLAVVRSLDDEDPDETQVMPAVGPAEPAPSESPNEPRPPSRIESLDAALNWWLDDVDPQIRRVRPLVVEFRDDGRYGWSRPLALLPGERVTIRAARGRRPTIQPAVDLEFIGHCHPAGQPGGSLTLDGLGFGAAPLVLRGALESVAIRHCTLAPALGMGLDGAPSHPDKTVLLLRGFQADLRIERSIVGAIGVRPPWHDSGVVPTGRQPPRFVILDSILDNARGPCPALGGQGCIVAFARLTAARTTVFGSLEVHALERAEDCLFVGRVFVARRTRGQIRFSYLQPDPANATPTLYLCQPVNDMDRSTRTPAVAPRFRSRSYGDPSYALLTRDTPDAIRAGASDEGEMGAFHDDYLALRERNLRARVADFTPVGHVTTLLFHPE
jgi:hypothetical protein